MPMSVETYRELKLHRQPELEVNGRGAEDFRPSLNHVGDAPYHPCPEAFPDETTPPGEVAAFRGWAGSKIFPGARRDIFVHMPAGLDRAGGANLVIFNDGVGYLSRKGAVRAGQVIDTLVARGEIAPTVGVFVNPGSLRDDAEPDWDQRRREYDPLTTDYGRFLIEELLPFVQAETGVAFSDHPGQRVVCGISSGGIAAFTTAWRFPEQFGGVISHCGSFVNIDGGHNYPFLVRSTPRKPIRIFIQSGENDGRNVYGHWPMANRVMADALEFAGYDVRFEFGTGGHTLRHGGALFADTLRWMFRPR
ncbi:MAG: esterase family protein [Caulobacteraceae bacterium]|nr:esterase family protein [Caulobacteraceae bacterium]